MENILSYRDFKSINESWNFKEFGKNPGLEFDDIRNEWDGRFNTIISETGKSMFFDPLGKLSKQTFNTVIDDYKYEFGYTEAFKYKFLADKKNGNVVLTYAYTEHNTIGDFMLNMDLKTTSNDDYHTMFYGYVDDNKIGFKNSDSLNKKTLDKIISNIKKLTKNTSLKLKASSEVLLNCHSQADEIDYDYSIQYSEFKESILSKLPHLFKIIWSSLNMKYKNAGERAHFFTKKNLKNLNIEEYSDEYHAVLKLIKGDKMKVNINSNKISAAEYKHKSTKYKFTEGMNY